MKSCSYAFLSLSGEVLSIWLGKGGRSRIGLWSRVEVTISREWRRAMPLVSLFWMAHPWIDWIPILLKPTPSRTRLPVPSYFCPPRSSGEVQYIKASDNSREKRELDRDKGEKKGKRSRLKPNPFSTPRLRIDIESESEHRGFIPTQPKIHRSNWILVLSSGWTITLCPAWMRKKGVFASRWIIRIRKRALKALFSLDYPSLLPPYMDSPQRD